MKRRDFNISCLAATALLSVPRIAEAKCRLCAIVGADLTGGLGGALVAGPIGAIVGGAGGSLSAAGRIGPEPSGGISSNPENPYDYIGQQHNRVITAYAKQYGRDFEPKNALEVVREELREARNLKDDQILELLENGANIGTKTFSMTEGELSRFAASMIPRTVDRGPFEKQVSTFLYTQIEEAEKIAIEYERQWAKLSENRLPLIGFSILRNSNILWS